MPQSRIITVTLNPAIDRVVDVDRLIPGAHQAGRLMARIAAGKGVNVSKALARLGVASIAAVVAGRDNLADYRALLSDPREQPYAAEIDLHCVPVPGAVRENLTLRDQATHAQTHIRDAGPALHPAAWSDVLGAIESLAIRRDDTLLFCGGLPVGVAPAQFAQLVDACIAAGAKVAVDSSSHALAAVRDRTLWLVKPNLDELPDLLPQPVGDDLLAAGPALAARHAFALLSLGEQGCLAFAGSLALRGRVKVAPAPIVSTVGCGDCLLAGFVAGIHRGGDFETAFRLALATAGANLSADGPARFQPQTVRELQTRVELSPLAR